MRSSTAGRIDAFGRHGRFVAAGRYTFDVIKPRISVESSGGTTYRVVVTQGGAETTHDVVVTPEDVARYAPGATPERLLEASFQFLLQREPASSILSRFALPVIERYFPEYPREISRMV